MSDGAPLVPQSGVCGEREFLCMCYHSRGPSVRKSLTSAPRNGIVWLLCGAGRWNQVAKTKKKVKLLATGQKKNVKIPSVYAVAMRPGGEGGRGAKKSRTKQGGKIIEEMRFRRETKY